MTQAKQILERIENHKGRKFDLNNHQDRFIFFNAIQREIDKKDIIINNVHNVLNGQSTYDKTQYKTILNRNRIKN